MQSVTHTGAAMGGNPQILPLDLSVSLVCPRGRGATRFLSPSLGFQHRSGDVTYGNWKRCNARKRSAAFLSHRLTGSS